jgi:hypothetical protein
MAEYQDILRFLALNPPDQEPDKMLHASLLEMLAKKLRGEEINAEYEVLKTSQLFTNNNKKYH